MQVSDALSHCEDCRRLAATTTDVDRQSLLLFLADAWRLMAATGDASSAVPHFLKQGGDRLQSLH
jgi:hypothetical protein